MGFQYTTNWAYETSEETSYSLLLSYSSGTLVLKEVTTGELMKIKYRCLSAGEGKGFPINMADSSFDTPSGGVGENRLVSDRIFDDSLFPCRGYILGAGAGLSTSRNLTMYLFGQLPVWAGVRAWGLSNVALPGVGLSGGLAHYWLP